MERFSVDIPKVFGIPITDRCHLRCRSCFNSDERFQESTHMEFDDFTRIVDWALNQGVEYLDLTPTVGEALLIPTLSKYLDYLDNSSVIMYTLITSLAHTNIAPLMNRPKMLTEVSLYGGNRDQYLINTNRDVFKLVRDNILVLAKDGRINVLKRFVGDITDSKLNAVMGLKNVRLLDYSEDRGLVVRFTGDVKKCEFMNEPLLTPSGISLCCIDYDYSNYIIGQIGDDLTEVYNDVENTIRIKKLNCSTGCDWFRPWKGDRGLDR